MSTTAPGVSRMSTPFIVQSRMSARATINRHPLDPDAPHRAVPLFGRLVASGLLDRSEALQALLHAPTDNQVSRSGLQARLTHALDDATRAHARRRGITEHRLRRAVAAPLLARMPRAALLAAADAADPDEDLLPRERRALVEAEVAWAVRTAASPPRRRPA